MQIQINTDHNIPGRESLSRWMEGELQDALGRFADRITRIEAHLGDENSTTKSGARDKRCLLEVRLTGQQPIVASHQAPEVNQAVAGAIDKMIKQLDSHLGRLASR